MRIQALSDIHVDHSINQKWLNNLSLQDHTDDVLILAGDISHRLLLLGESLNRLRKRFRHVVFVPGNHDLWVNNKSQLSTDKFLQVMDVCKSEGVNTETLELGTLRIVPLLSWYDYSFGKATNKLLKCWMDFEACRWPPGYNEQLITRFFLNKNQLPQARDCTTISFSHFLPRIDLMPKQIPKSHRIVYPVLGATKIDEQVRAVDSKLHVYGHSHVNRDIEVDGIRYVNNAFANPSESHIARKELYCVYDTASRQTAKRRTNRPLASTPQLDHNTS